LRTGVAGDVDPELAQLANDPDVAPAAILARQPQNKPAHLAVDWRSTGTPVRIRPVAGDEPTMPAQERLRPDHERPPRPTRQHPAERSQQQPVIRRELRPPHLPPQDRQLVPQHQDLELLRALATREQHDQLEQTAGEDVHQRHDQESLRWTGASTLPGHQS
jgi:hypothetical protein